MAGEIEDYPLEEFGGRNDLSQGNPIVSFIEYWLTRDIKPLRSHLAIRSNFDYAHSVFPLYQWRHSVGAFQISPSPPNTTTNSSSSPSSSSPSSEPPAAAPPPALQASALWKWRVDWKANTTGVVSTGTYEDVFEKRGEEWKVLRRVSRDDPNWPLYVFAPYADNAEGLYRSSCGDT